MQNFKNVFFNDVGGGVQTLSRTRQEVGMQEELAVWKQPSLAVTQIPMYCNLMGVFEELLGLQLESGKGKERAELMWLKPIKRMYKINLAK